MNMLSMFSSFIQMLRNIVKSQEQNYEQPLPSNSEVMYIILALNLSWGGGYLTHVFNDILLYHLTQVLFLLSSIFFYLHTKPGVMFQRVAGVILTFII